MTAQHDRRRRLVTALGGDRVAIFVPAIMSVGLAFWIVNELRDLARVGRERARRRRAALAAAAIVARDAPGGPTQPPEALGLRPRPVYAVVALTFLGGAAYVFVGSTANFLRDGGYVADIGWLLAVSTVLAAAGVLYGVAAASAWARYPAIPPLTRRLVVASPLTTTPVEAGRYPGRASWRLSTATVATLAGAALLSLMVGWSPHVVRRLDDTVADWLAAHDLPGPVGGSDPLGRTEIAIGLAALGGLAVVRCRVLASSFLLSVGAGLVVSLTVRPLVARPRPATGPFTGALDSFPSGHVLLGTVIAGLLPEVVFVLTGRRSLRRPVALVLGMGVAASGIHRVASGYHWPTDLAGGFLIGATLVLATRWALATEASHRNCHGCPWNPHAGRPPRRRGVLPLHAQLEAYVRVAGHATASAAAIGLAVMTALYDVPADPDGAGWGAAIDRPVQFALAGLVSVGALLAWRWPAVGAVVIALAATGLGTFASFEYPPEYGVALTAALVTPAVLLWLGWQHRRHHGEILTLALVTALLLGGTWAAAQQVYDAQYGPTHPESTTRPLELDRVEWVWTGGLTATELSVSVRLVGDGRSAVVVATPVEGGPVVRSAAAVAGEHRIAAARLVGLTPDTEYTFVVEVDGRDDAGRGVGRFRTPGTGPFSFTVALGSCARTGTNGSVFDTIRAADPLLFLALGDLHYRNLAGTDPQPFLAAYDTLLTSPAPAALARSAPWAYVWDDHDYGPNDAGADAPGRSAVRHAYRLAFPHYPVPAGDAPIFQAFTIGRVRFVITDGRSERTATTMLGAEQEAWLIDELTESSRTHALVVWVNGTPWIGAARAGADTWAGYAAERGRIGTAIAAAGIDDLVMVSGDAHMVAIDDGTNSGYGPGGSGGFPVLHAAALDRPGNVKGGPYSEGTFPGSGQFGLLEIDDDGGDSVTVRMAGLTWAGETLVELERTFEGAPSDTSPATS